MSSRVEDRLKALDLRIPQAPEPVGYYLPVVRSGNFVITSGQLPIAGKEIMFTGKIGDKLHEQDGYHAAQLCTLNALAQIKKEIGSLDRVTRVIRVDGFIASAPGFTAQPQVLNGASRLLVEIFGELGKHTRVAVGVAELPLNAAVEVALWVEVEPDPAA